MFACMCAHACMCVCAFLINICGQVHEGSKDEWQSKYSSCPQGAFKLYKLIDGFKELSIFEWLNII